MLNNLRHTHIIKISLLHNNIFVSDFMSNDVPVTVAFSAPEKSCVEKPINLPVYTCGDITEEITIEVPATEDVTETLDLCTYTLGEPECKKQEICLPSC